MKRKIKIHYERNHLKYTQFKDEIKMMIRVLKENHCEKDYLEMYQKKYIFSMYDLINYLYVNYKQFTFVSFYLQNTFFTNDSRSFFYNTDLIVSLKKFPLSRQMLFFSLNSTINMNLRLLNSLNYTTYQMQNNFLIKLYFNIKNKIKY